MAISGISSMASGGALQGAQAAQTAASTSNQVATIGAQMQSEKMKTDAQIHQIQEETRTKVAEMFRETHLNKVKSSTKIHDKYVQQMMA